MILMPDWAVDISPLSAVASVFAGLTVLVSVFTLARGALEWAVGRSTNSPDLAVTGRRRVLQGLAGAFVAGMIGAWLAGILHFGRLSPSYHSGASDQHSFDVRAAGANSSHERAVQLTV